MRHKTLIALLIATLAISSVPAGAAPPLPIGKEIRVSAISPPEFRYSPSVAVFPDGGFVVAWGSANGSKIRFFDRQARPLGGERPLLVAGVVDEVVTDGNGSFLAVWTDYSVPRVLVRRFNRNGTPRGPSFQVHEPSESGRHEGVIAVAQNGRIAVAWRSDVPLPGSEDGGHTTDAVGRVFTPQGVPLTPEITLLPGEAPSPAGDDAISARPTSLALASDGTLSAMVQDNECLSSGLVQASLDGETRGLGGFSVSCNGFENGRPALARGLDGRLVATWSTGLALFQRFAPDGAPQGAADHVSTAWIDRQTDPAVALQAGGNFLIVWAEDERDGDGYGIFGRSFAADGRPRTQDFRINTTTAGDQLSPAMAAARQGPALVVWRHQTGENQYEIFARVLAAKP